MPSVPKRPNYRNRRFRAFRKNKRDSSRLLLTCGTNERQEYSHRGVLVAGFAMPFQKGVSGNPSGRPKGYAEVEKLAREHTAASIKALSEALSDPKTAVPAATALLDRGWGRPAQKIEANVNVLEHLSDASLDRLLAIVGDTEDGQGDPAPRSQAH